MIAWLPISTAPKDRPIQGGRAGFLTISASWAEPYYADGPGEWVDSACRRIDPPLTHWAPLLESPES